MNLKIIAIPSILSCLFLSGCDLGDRTPSIKTNGATVPHNLKKTSFSKLPGWKDDDVRYALRAFKNTCKAKIQPAGKVIPDTYLLSEKCKIIPSESADVPTVRAWFESNFQSYQLADECGKTNGTFRGYYSPIVNACRSKTSVCSAPIMDKPANGQNYVGIPAKDLVKNRIGRVIYWIDPIDLQDMGSATLILEDGSKVRLSVTSTNNLPFNGIGAQLKTRGIRPPEGYGMKSVRKYLKENRSLANELIANNPRYVYYSESKTEAVTGTMGIPLSKIRSIAVDKNIYTLGMPVYINTNLSDGKKFQRLMIAQDTGGAIKGWVRGDIYFGVGDEAFKYAQGQHANGTAYMLMPKPYEKVEPTY